MSIFDWKGTARLRESHRYPAALRQHVSVVDIITPNRRVPYLKWMDCEQKETEGDDRMTYRPGISLVVSDWATPGIFCISWGIL